MAIHAFNRPATLRTNELKLADTVQLFEGPFGTAIVTQITETEVIFHRCYGTTADFSHAGGVIHWTGLEVVKIPVSSSQTFQVWSRKDLN